ncbi:MAG: TetR/AcrR family transcriptional regulator [Bacteroidota bacterium]
MVEKSSKDRLVATAAKLIWQKGYFGTGISEVLQKSGVPKGSLYHHFPDGKMGLIREALHHASGIMLQQYETAMRGTKTPEKGLAAIMEHMAAVLEESEFRYGCPLATVALETTGETNALIQVLQASYEMWEDALAGYLALKQVRGARDKAGLFLTLLEGGFVLAKARRDASFIRRLIPRLSPLVLTDID